MAENTNKKPSIWSRMGKFFKDCKSEFKKLVWPTPKQLMKNSALVLVSIVVVGSGLALVDAGLGEGLHLLKNLFLNLIYG